ncbi:dihydrodipicolinate synthase family protein [Corynebacterium glucuronolyticum]|uniref:Dihydrodipicolinate synthase family protein n=1 Tax=Corynebacterium glucuronolyticum TaxID=39791 RepID=A0AAX1L8H3_9CORY|nr:dihydrodipicolinate synthase family protein [Corynebacterium glucuronolyticum]QRP70738.1 dihydrodipicolinate synthase family protein [Corynebacterium glucuronolyticum]
MSRCRDPAQRGTGLVDKLVRDNPNIIGVKDTIDSLAHNRSLIQAVGDRIAIFSGFDEY